MHVYLVWFSAVQNFFRIENPLNINKVMDRNVCTCLYRPYRHSIALNALEILCLYQLYQHNNNNNNNNNNNLFLYTYICHQDLSFNK